MASAKRFYAGDKVKFTSPMTGKIIQGTTRQVREPHPTDTGYARTVEKAWIEFNDTSMCVPVEDIEHV